MKGPRSTRLLSATRRHAGVVFDVPASGGELMGTGVKQIPLSYSNSKTSRLTLPIRQCSRVAGEIELGPLASMMRSFFRLDGRSPFARRPGALIGALSVGALIAVAFAERAAADDTRTTNAPASPFSSSTYNWTGFYAGGQLGYAWGTSKWTESEPGAPNISGSFGLGQPVDIFSESGSFFGGLQAGYNYMLPNRIVFGAEVDATFPSFPDLSGISIGGISNLTSPTFGAETFSETVLASGTVRGRIGYAPGSWLFYATGGFAWTYASYQ
jgi:opacity protein-like surface antigen